MIHGLVPPGDSPVAALSTSRSILHVHVLRVFVSCDCPAGGVLAPVPAPLESRLLKGSPPAALV